MDEVKATLAGNPILRARTGGSEDGIHELEVVPALGGSTLTLRGRLRGETFPVFPERDRAELERGLASDPNFAFKRLNTPLFPNTNRLLPDAALPRLRLGDAFTATVAGIPVRMKHNHQGSKPGAIPHQLHGLLYRAPGTAETDGHSITCRFEDFFDGLWTGSASVEITQSLENGAYFYRMSATNTGATPLPAGFGTHPYFRVPCGDPARARVVIPASRYAEIDQFDNVLPTGRFLPTAGTPYDFSPGAPTRLDHWVDNYFVLDRGARSVELLDESMKARLRMTALTPNIIGAQMFYPGKGDVVALELVTHHPDPREALWGDERTGMQVLRPGETAQYAYRIEVLPL